MRYWLEVYKEPVPEAGWLWFAQEVCYTDIANVSVVPVAQAKDKFEICNEIAARGYNVNSAQFVDTPTGGISHGISD